MPINILVTTVTTVTTHPKYFWYIGKKTAWRAWPNCDCRVRLT